MTTPESLEVLLDLLEMRLGFNKESGDAVMGADLKDWDTILSLARTGLEPKARIAELKGALEAAQNGLRWYQETFPNAASQADDEMEAQINKALLGGEGDSEPPLCKLCGTYPQSIDALCWICIQNEPEPNHDR